MSSGFSLFLGLWLMATVSQASDLKYPFFPHSDEDKTRIMKMVDDINNADLPWKAEYNAQASLKEGREKTNEEKMELFSTMMKYHGQIMGDTESHLKKLAASNLTLPKSFDARDYWPRCSSIHHIQNQGGCGDCWAAASVSVMSDRLCISSNSTDQSIISLQDLASCCEFCGKCAGAGSIAFPFIHWKNNGIVTGGSFGSNEGCRPYEVESTCGSPCPKYFYHASFNPQCDKTCSTMYGKDYDVDLRKGKSFYWLAMAATQLRYAEFNRIAIKLPILKTDLIKTEIVTNGPVAMCTKVTEPLAHYRSGIFTSSEFDIKGHASLNYGHCLRIIGWGVENGLEFWTIANSFGRQWGKNGFGRISMESLGENCDVVGGLW